MIRENGDHLISVCNADETLFPQHLLLGPAVNMSVDGGRVDYRNYFMPSGAMQSCCGQVGGLRLEFKRLVLLLQDFVLPVAYSDTVGGEAVDPISVRITPDVLGNVSLSEKSIPFYYDVNRPGDTDKLYRYWDYSKTHAGHADRNLSYNADQYRTGNSDDPILQPLYYDLENYNFLRIEGHIGLSYREAVNTILGIRDRHRLPFEVIAIRTTLPADSILKKLCCGDGLELSYDIVRREWEAVVGATIAYINNNLESSRSLLGYNEFDANEADVYVDKLQKVKAYLVNDMSAFMVRYDEFIEKYEEIESESARLRDKVYGQLGEQGGSMYTFGEDMIDHLDAAGHSAKKGAFRAIEQAWMGLAASVEETLSLHEYARVHPGISHKAGVPMGGTFVIIYHTENAEEDDKALVRKASSQVPGSVDQMLAKIPEGMVIADFYLPYLCCSDCSPVEVSIGNGKPPVVKPTISIEGNITSLCSATAKENYSLTIQPDEASVTATVNGANVSGVVVNNGSSWQFIPSAVTFASNENQKTVKITAEKDGQTSSIQIVVYAQPVLAFNWSPNPNDPNTITFTGASTHIAGNANVTWTFSNSNTGYTNTINSQASTPVSNTFPTLSADQVYTVTLSAANNGACTTAPASQNIPVKSSLPCGGEKQTCNFVWPYAQDRTVLMKAMVADTQTQSIVLNLQILNFKVEGQAPYFIPSQPLTFTVPSIQPFSDNWRIIAQKINALYQSVSMPVIFGTTAGAYQNTGYLVPLTSYACLGFEFEFNFWITVNGVPQSQYKDHYLFVKDKSGTSTFQILKDNTTKSLVYKDPKCSNISSPPISR